MVFAPGGIARNRPNYVRDRVGVAEPRENRRARGHARKQARLLCRGRKLRDYFLNSPALIYRTGTRARARAGEQGSGLCYAAPIPDVISPYAATLLLLLRSRI